MNRTRVLVADSQRDSDKNLFFKEKNVIPAFKRSMVSARLIHKYIYITVTVYTEHNLISFVLFHHLDKSSLEIQ